jgi:hypothetical protein
MAEEFDGWIRGDSLGEGGQAWTYLAYRREDEERSLPFVLKVLKHMSNAARLKRFEREIVRNTGFEQKTYHLGLNFKNVPNQKWLIMACDYCGHLQWFRADMAQKNSSAWEQGGTP